MKVMHIVEAYGGGVFEMINLILKYSSKDVENVLVCGVRPEAPTTWRLMLPSNVKAIELPSFCKSINPKKDIQSLKAVIDLIKQEKPDVVHTHSSKAGVIGRIAAKICRIPDSCIFYSPHGYAHRSKFFSKKSQTVFKTIEMVLGRLIGSTIACSSDEYREAEKLGINHRQQLFNAVECQHITPVPISNKTKSRVVSSGRIQDIKNPEFFDELAEDNPDFEFVWIGGGDYYQFKHVKTTGWMSKEEVLKELDSAFCYVACSHQEGLPVAVLEAQAKGLPALCTQISSYGDIVTKDTGYLLDNDLLSWKKALKSLKDAELWEFFHKNASARIKSNFSAETYVRELEAIYKKGVMNV